MIRTEPGAPAIGGRFTLVRQLGEGGMGVVWEAVEVATQARCAIKFLKPEDTSPMSTRRLRREAEAAAAVQHDNIVRVLEIAEDADGTPAIVMELLEGESLGQRIERVGSLPPGQVAAILLPVASALRAAHAAGIIHRDLKPDNVFLATHPDGTIGVRVLDFGIAKQIAVKTESLTVTGSILGTPMYMSPEQASGERGIDARTDVWSFAVIAFECLSGVMPVTGENYGQILTRLIRGEISRLAQVAPNLPADLIGMVDGALVHRDFRPRDFDSAELILRRYADRAIARAEAVTAPRQRSIRVQSDAGDQGGLLETQLVGTTAQRVPTQRRRSAVGSGAALVGVATVAMFAAAGLFVYARANAPREDSIAPAAHTPVTVEAPATASVIMPAVVPSAEPAASAVSSAPVAPTAAPGPEPSASVAAGASARPPGTPKLPRPRTAPASSAPKKLQGGVAGDVPF